LLWSKQFYHYDVYRWLMGDPTTPAPPAARWHGQNRNWKELHNTDVILMPDTWEYPWYASWDLAFHCVALARIDPACAKEQLRRMSHEWYQHASGQFPAYEWNFDDVNPPLLGWAAWRIYQIEQELTGKGDGTFLKEIFQNEMPSFSLTPFLAHCSTTRTVACSDKPADLKRLNVPRIIRLDAHISKLEMRFA
jgi:hypothetical protein